MHNCGNGGFGGAQFAVIQVPFSLVGANSSATTSNSGAIGTAPGIAYVPPAGSPLTGATDAGKAFDKIGDLLKLLNNAGFTAGNTGTIPVYDAVTGKFVPTAAADILDEAAMASLLKDLFASGASGAILQKQPDGSIAAVAMPGAIKSAFPSAVTDDVLTYNGTSWVAAPAVTAAKVSDALAALTPGVATEIVGLDATGNGVTMTPAQLAAAGVAAAPAATATNPLRTISGLDAAGLPVKAVVGKMGEITSGSVTPSGVLAAGVPLSTVTAPKAGLYALSANNAVTVTAGAGGLTPPAGGLGVCRYNFYALSNGAQVYNGGIISSSFFNAPVAAGVIVGSAVLVEALAVIEMAAGQTVDLMLDLSVTSAGSVAGSVVASAAHSQQLTLRYLGNRSLEG